MGTRPLAHAGAPAPAGPPDAPTWVAALTRVDLEPTAARRLGLVGHELRLGRAWPRSPDHVLLELRDGGGGAVAGQWMRDGHRLEQVRAETADRCPGVPLAILECSGGAVLLQPRGADRVLPTLHQILSRSGARLLAHRAERRAVVRLGEASSAAARYLKIVSPDRVARLVGQLLLLRECDLHFRVPRLLDVQPDDGSVVLAPLDGASLHDLLVDPARLIAAARGAGRALRSLHDVDLSQLASEPSRRHDPARVIRELGRRIEHLAVLNRETSNRIAAALPAVTAALEETSPPFVLIHRDFHDKQVLLREDGGIGILDFDLLSLGDAALDVSNMLVHFELRALQRLCPTPAARDAAGAFLEGYAADAETAARFQPYLDATRLRLAGLYALRPTWDRIPDLLIARVGLEALDPSVATWR